LSQHDDHIDLLVVGGGPAALSSATAYREHGGAGRVRVISDDDTLPYFRPALSKEYLRGEVSEPDMALTDTSSLAEHDIEVSLNHTVTSIDAAQRSVTLLGGTQLLYQSCVLATGATPKPLPVPGALDQRVSYLRTAGDGRSLRAAAQRGRSAAVIGSGFIGCEAAVSLARLGLDVVVVSAEPLPQRQRLGHDAGQRLHRWLNEEGVRFVGDASVQAIDDGRQVHVDGHAPITADVVLIAAGIEPRSGPVDTARVPTYDGRLVVDEYMRSEVPGLLAAGDIAYAHNASAGRHLVVEHWGEATAMGTIAGTTAAGRLERWEQAPGFWSAIGDNTLKYAAWGDGYDNSRLVEHDAGAFSIWYLSDDTIVGVLTHDADDDYERGRELVQKHALTTAICRPRSRRSSRD
jgi:NADPH-dependent 2,4-dienoyl-CoA reductase/sulfur reductase-like enzyme